MIFAMSEWKVNKDINLGEILTMLTLVVTFVSAMVVFFILQDRRIEGNTVTSRAHGEKISMLESGQSETRSKIESLRLEQKEDMHRLGQKVDQGLNDIKNILIKDK